MDKISTILELNNKNQKNIAGKIKIKLNQEEIGEVEIYKKIHKKKKKTSSFFQKIKELLI